MFYAGHGARLGYTIVGAPALSVPRAHVTRLKGSSSARSGWAVGRSSRGGAPGILVFAAVASGQRCCSGWRHGRLPELAADPTLSATHFGAESCGKISVFEASITVRVRDPEEPAMMRSLEPHICLTRSGGRPRGM